MYSDKPSVNILTALLVAHGIKHAVVCPGSRNAAIVHNLNECGTIGCHPVTDERSAGFFALGIAQHTDEAVAVCVTSGTALLNLAPAVAEAYHQHQSLVVISADRPQAWIGQLDGQTLQQPGALSAWVSKTVTLPEVTDEQSEWYCNRLVNEALIEATSTVHPCVHINVPLSEPLFRFTVSSLPCQRVIRRYNPPTDYDCLPQMLIDGLMQAERPMVVLGQLSARRFHYEGMSGLFGHVIVLHEALSPLTGTSPLETVFDRLAERLPQHPDFILHVGDGLVSKRLKHFLRQAPCACTWRVSLTGEVEDTFQNLQGLIVGDAEQVLCALATKYSEAHKVKANHAHAAYRRAWLQLFRDADAVATPGSDTSLAEGGLPMAEAAVATLERQLDMVSLPCDVHYANSTAIRLANVYARKHSVWCNRGTNGIEGSLSTAAGFAAVSTHLTVCVIGDLSFFYDQNALWNGCIGGNLRILLLNNGHGAIFDHLPGLSRSPVASTFVAGRHHTTAAGICHQNGVEYRAMASVSDMQPDMEWLLEPGGERPRLLEVFELRVKSSLRSKAAKPSEELRVES